MAISYEGGEFVTIPDDCPDCGVGLYDSGCDAPGHPGRGCPDCGWGCDYELVDDEESRCVAAMEAEPEEEHAARIDEERAAFGLRPAR